MKKNTLFLFLAVVMLCSLNACGLFGGGGGEEELTDDVYTATEVATHQDNTYGGMLARDIYEEEILKAQNGEQKGKYSILRSQESDSFAIEKAKEGAEIARQRVLADNLIEEQTCYRVFVVEDLDSADFVIQISISSLFGSAIPVKHGYRYYRMEAITYAQPESVDLGLGVLWATWNVGATSAEEYGGFYAWGETEQKESYTWENYAWGDGTTFSKYFNTTASAVLEEADDAASVHLGNGWRTPTYYEMKDLIDKCTWTEEFLNGVRCYRVTGATGKSIVMPLSGAKDENGINTHFGWYGNYHIANTNHGRLGTTWYLRFHGDGQYLFTSDAAGGIPVRPVKNKN